jgi:hypothetical protein
MVCPTARECNRSGPTATLVTCIEAAGIEFHAGGRLEAIIPAFFRTATWTRSFAVQQVDALQRPRFVAQCGG